MKKYGIILITICLMFTSTALAANNNIKTTTEKETKITIPVKNAVSWQNVSFNNKFQAFYDDRNITYNKDSGIITVWTKYVYNGLGPNKEKELWILSNYDVRIKTYANLYYASYNTKGLLVNQGPIKDQSWFTINEGSIGEDFLNALQKYLLAN